MKLQKGYLIVRNDGSWFFAKNRQRQLRFNEIRVGVARGIPEPREVTQTPNVYRECLGHIKAAMAQYLQQQAFIQFEGGKS